MGWNGRYNADGCHGVMPEAQKAGISALGAEHVENDASNISSYVTLVLVT